METFNNFIEKELPERIFGDEEAKNYDFKNEKINGFLENQIDLPPEKRNDEFKQFIEQTKREKSLEFEEKGKIKDTTENRLRAGLEMYLKDLDLKEEDLKDKNILDMGSGHGEFMFYCLENGISENVYGIEPNADRRLEDFKIWDQNAENKSLVGADFTALFKKHSDRIFKINYFKDELPPQKFDYIFSRASLSIYNSKEDAGIIYDLLKKSADSLNNGGEIRIFPIFRGFKNKNVNEGEYKDWEELAQKICSEEGITYSLRPVDVYFGEGKEVLLKEILVLKKGESNAD